LKLLITPKDLKKRVLKIWQRGEMHRSWLQNTDYFPLEIPLKNIPAKALLSDFSELQDAIAHLRQDSKKQGYLLVDKTITHRQLGEQKIPARVVFETEANLLNYLSKTAEFNQFKTLSQQTIQQHELLEQWIICYPFKAMKYVEVWAKILNVCHYFLNNPQPSCYIRQLDIKGVDSKFIEQHKGILNELLPQILSETDYQKDITGLNNHGFERRYGLLYDQPLIRLRILDNDLAIHGLTDLTLTVDEFRQLNIAVKTVFIAENKINGLAFPNHPKSIVIFGLGYAVNLLAEAQCLNNKAIYYWGDIDTHGFAILSRLRHYYPEAQSLLMDQQTLQQFKALCVDEVFEKSEQKTVKYLTADENKLFQQLQKILLRLEQERIGFSYLQHALRVLVDISRDGV
jgi:hypothetical protein